MKGINGIAATKSCYKINHIEISALSMSKHLIVNRKSLQVFQGWVPTKLNNFE